MFGLFVEGDHHPLPRRRQTDSSFMVLLNPLPSICRNTPLLVPSKVVVRTIVVVGPATRPKTVIRRAGKQISGVLTRAACSAISRFSGCVAAVMMMVSVDPCAIGLA